MFLIQQSKALFKEESNKNQLLFMLELVCNFYPFMPSYCFATYHGVHGYDCVGKKREKKNKQNEKAEILVDDGFCHI